MKTNLHKISFIVALLLPLGLCAQTKYTSANELRGSGKLVTLSPAVGKFDGIEIKQFPATVTVEVGGSESTLTLTIDDNLGSFVKTETKNGTLLLTFRDTDKEGFWVSKANITVKIKTPSLTRLSHSSNSDVSVSGLTGEQFALANDGNGTVTLTGKVNNFELASAANGTVMAESLLVKQANVATQANASIRINAQQVNVVNAANATVTNVAFQKSKR
jgi:Putative auto-transporter adhesin, head GIN domain